MELLIGILAIVVASYYIVKGYTASGVLLSVGLALLLISLLMGKSILPDDVKSTGVAYLDIIEYVKYLLTNRGGGLGMIIMSLCGFAAYMTHLGANNMVIKLVSKPLRYVRSPYAVMTVAYFLASLMSLAVSSAAGLAVLLMATLFPIMVNTGISRGAAATICASPAAIILSPVSGDVVLAAEVSKMNIIDFAFKTTLPISIIAMIAIAISNFFWQRYLDRKLNQQNETLDVGKIETNVPSFYAIFPFTPIIGVLIFNGIYDLGLNIITIIICCFLVVALVDFFRSFNAKQVFLNLNAAYRGMADAFANVVVLLVAAGVFAQGLSSCGFIQQLIGFSQNLGSGAFAIMLMLALITICAAIATGSGNAPFYAFAELIPKLAAHTGINPTYLVIPMLQASNIGRSLSPVSGVVVAVSSMANVSPFEIVKRMSVPMIVGLIAVIVATELTVPV